MLLEAFGNALALLLTNLYNDVLENLFKHVSARNSPISNGFLPQLHRVVCKVNHRLRCSLHNRIL